MPPQNAARTELQAARRAGRWRRVSNAFAFSRAISQFQQESGGESRCSQPHRHAIELKHLEKKGYSDKSKGYSPPGSAVCAAATTSAPPTPRGSLSLIEPSSSEPGRYQVSNYV